MATAAVIPPLDVSADLNYYKPIGDEPPFRYINVAGQASHNLGDDPRPVIVHDARGNESAFSLDMNGFQFARHRKSSSTRKRSAGVLHGDRRTAEEGDRRQARVSDGGMASKHTVLNRIVRRRPESDASLPNREQRGPVERVHIDQTYDASVRRVRQLLGADAERLLQSRVRLINVWRPIGHPVAHKPLALGDWRTLDGEADLVPVRYIYPDRIGATFSVRYNPNHKWYYLSNQTPEEVTLIKCYDSETDRARLTPHTAFVDVSGPKNAPHRESIEIRAFVFDEE
ncbi:hypothetical protein A0H81_11138, partial [Grifola frondosa]